MVFKKYRLPILLMAIVIASLCAWFWMFEGVSIQSQIDKSSARGDMVKDSTLVSEEPLHVDSINTADCQPTGPKSGSKYLLTGDGADTNKYTKLFIGNEHGFPVWIRVFDHATTEEYGAIYLEAHKSSFFHLPANGYNVIVESGTNWCNLQVGFHDAVLVHSDKVVYVLENETASLRVLSFGTQPSDMMLSMSGSANLTNRAKKVIGTGTLTLQRVVGGHYAVEGSINGVAANFLVDTGATTVAIPEDFAKHAGITACRKSKYRTANGLTDICIAKAKELTIGHFVLKDVEVSYGKGMPEDTYLLGMNVISLFRMEQYANTMKLSLR